VEVTPPSPCEKEFGWSSEPVEGFEEAEEISLHVPGIEHQTFQTIAYLLRFNIYV
jgi:hypothetical protein